MPSLDEKVYALDTRVSKVEQQISISELSVKHQGLRIDTMEDDLSKYMEHGEISRKAIVSKIDEILKYKWIILGALLTAYLISGSGPLLAILKGAL